MSSPKNNQTNDEGIRLMKKNDEGQSLSESDLVIDILNDELISLVKQKILSKIEQS